MSETGDWKVAGTRRLESLRYVSQLQNCSSRREEAPYSLKYLKYEPRYLGCYGVLKKPHVAQASSVRVRASSRCPIPVGNTIMHGNNVALHCSQPSSRTCCQSRVKTAKLPGMKSLTEHLWFEVPNRRGFVNITGTVEDLVKKSGVQEGLCLVNAMHITASVFINDDEDGLLHDYDDLAGEACAARTDEPIPAQPHRRRQCRRAPETPDHGPRSRRGHHAGAGSISGRGNRSSTASSTAAAGSACW